MYWLNVIILTIHRQKFVEQILLSDYSSFFFYIHFHTYTIDELYHVKFFFVYFNIIH